MEELNEAFLQILCGDLIAHIGTKNHFIKVIDIITPTIVIDENVNSHDNVFIEFLSESKLFMYLMVLSYRRLVTLLVLEVSQWLMSL